MQKIFLVFAAGAIAVRRNCRRLKTKRPRWGTSLASRASKSSKRTPSPRMASKAASSKDAQPMNRVAQRLSHVEGTHVITNDQSAA